MQPQDSVQSVKKEGSAGSKEAVINVLLMEYVPKSAGFYHLVLLVAINIST